MRGGTKKLAKTEPGDPAGVGIMRGGEGGTPKVPIGGLAEVDNNSLDELSRFEPPERPPSLARIQEITGHRFSEQWLKYIYNRFKHECPAGRMKFAEFRRLFGTFIPDRLGDSYLERMFCAFCCQQSSASPPHVDYITFEDLVVSLHRLCDENARDNAEWTMRLIGGGGTQPQQITFREFFEFVRSVFTLRGRGDQSERQRNAGSLLMGGTGTSAASLSRESAVARKPTIVRSAAAFASAITTPTAAPAIAHFGRARSSSGTDADALRVASAQRATVLFKELDADEKGFLTANDFERFFARQQRPLVFVS
ncbi:hypothetical protein GPALN_011201 [Globodera pallida]|nr:hypothetical protein GPALN_011201 [Globodera pallida]